jgi:hypothetical protein
MRPSVVFHDQGDEDATPSGRILVVVHRIVAARPRKFTGLEDVLDLRTVATVRGARRVRLRHSGC